MKKNKKKKIDIAKNISSLKKDLLDSQNNQNNLKLNNKINRKIGTSPVKSSNKIEIINNINTEDNENVQEILEKLYIEELNKFKNIDSKKEKLRDINLNEKNATDLYNWNTLLNRKISFEKRNEFNQKNNKKKFNNFNKINYDLVDYKKGMNVVCKISNEILLNFYKDILQHKKLAPELSPKIKLKHKNNISNLIMSGRISSKDREKIFHNLTLNEKENPNFRDDDLKITIMRKTADVLLKALLVKNKITENSKNNSKIIENNKKNNGIKKKKGLILSLYDENNPEIIKFNEEIHSLSEQNKNKITIFDDLKEEENLTNFNKRNIFSAHNLKVKSIFSNNRIYNKKTLKNYSYGSTDFSINSIISSNIKNKVNFFNGNGKKKENKISIKLYSNKKNKSKKIPYFRPMSSYNTMNYNNQNKLYFINNKSNKRSLSYEDFDEIGFLNGFPKKESSKVGNSIYDKINRILKYRIIKKLKLNLKNNSNNLITKAINSKYNKKKEETKSNKYIQTFLSANISKTSDSDMMNSISKCRDNRKLSSKEKEKDELNKNTKNFYSCSNNYLVNIHRTKIHKFLNELSDNGYLNLNKIIVEDKFTQKDSNKKIKSMYNHNK